MIDNITNERELYKAQALIRTCARPLGAEEQGRLNETIADDFAATTKTVLGHSTSKDCYVLAESFHKTSCEVWSGTGGPKLPGKRNSNRNDKWLKWLRN